MAALIKGETVTLYERRQTGEDAFHAPVWEEIPVQVENVLISPVSTSDIIGELQLSGHRGEYELHIPKGDIHNWENCRVDFWGQSWRTFGHVRQWMEHAVPLDWNRCVKVEIYG